MRSPRSRSGRGLLRACVALILVLAAACTPAAEQAAPPTAAPGPADPLLDIARREKIVGVIVQLALEQERPGVWNRREIAREQEKLVEALKPGVTVVTRYEEFPQIALEVTPDALRRLRRYPLVMNISLNETDEPTE